MLVYLVPSCPSFAKWSHLIPAKLRLGHAEKSRRIPRNLPFFQVPVQVDQAPVQMQAWIYFGVPTGQPLYGETGYRFVCKGTPKIRRLRLIIIIIILPIQNGYNCVCRSRFSLTHVCLGHEIYSRYRKAMRCFREFSLFVFPTNRSGLDHPRLLNGFDLSHL